MVCFSSGINPEESIQDVNTSIKCIHEYGLCMCTETYCIRGALQQKIDGSVYIFVAVMEGYHALILSFPSYLNQLRVGKIKNKKLS